MENELANNANVEETETKPVDSAELDKRIKQLEAENARLKQSVTNASADASKWKKEAQAKDSELQSRMTEEEKAKAQQDADTAAMKQELETLRNERNVANYKAQFVSIGFEEVIAQGTAEALNKGETAKLFDGIRKFIASHDKQLMAQSLMNNPTITGGVAKKTMSREEFDKMGYSERVKLYNEDPALYKEMTS